MVDLRRKGRFAAIVTIVMAAFAPVSSPWSMSALAQGSGPAAAVPAPKTAKPARPSPKSSGDYFIEFRAAKIGGYGHSYVAYGRLDRRGNPENTSYADLHPRGNYAVMALGHFIPVPANTEWDPEVLTLPVSYKYRVKLNEGQYNSLLGALERHKANPRYWNALTYNCNHFVGELAEAVGLRVPGRFNLSTGFIPELQELNTGSPPVFVPDAEEIKNKTSPMSRGQAN
jgi:hypothetical protein